MDESKKLLFIINPYSGVKFRPRVEGRILAFCQTRGFECTIEFTQHPGHATELTRQAVKENFYRVIAVGGDGTVNEVAQGLNQTNTVMGIIPIGSGNGLARHLRIPINVQQALRLLTSGKMIRMDTIQINDLLSVNVSGIGFDGHVAGLFGKNRRRGLMGYSRLAVKEFRRFKEFQVRINKGDFRFERKAFILAIANSSQFGNNARIAPYASVCDQLIDACIIRKPPLSKAVGFAGRMFTNRLGKSSLVEIVKSKSIEILLDSPVPYHIDGEGRGSGKEFRVEVIPESLSVLVPDHKRRI